MTTSVTSTPVLKECLGIDMQATWKDFVHVADEIRDFLPEGKKVRGSSQFEVAGNLIEIVQGDINTLLAHFMQIASSDNTESAPPEEGWVFRVDGHHWSRSRFRFGFSASPDEPGYYICRDH